MNISLKYYAGLIDADGSIDFRPVKRAENDYYIRPKVTITQKDDYDQVLTDFANEYGSKVYTAKTYKHVTLQGNAALRCLQQLKQYLVIKKEVSKYILSIDKIHVSKDQLKELRQSVRVARATSSYPNYPSRKWLAGYFDGDGCIHTSQRKSDGALEFKLNLTSHYSQECGLELVQKAYSGSIIKQQDTRRWNLHLSQHSAEKILPILQKHSRIKRSQVAYSLGVIRSGKHFLKRGATRKSNRDIHLLLQEMKRKPATTKYIDTSNSDVIV